jgi:hypothetical protein
MSQNQVFQKSAGRTVYVRFRVMAQEHAGADWIWIADFAHERDAEKYAHEIRQAGQSASAWIWMYTGKTTAPAAWTVTVQQVEEMIDSINQEDKTVKQEEIARILTVTAQEPAQDGGKEYTFQAYEITTGECCVPYETSADGWFQSVHSIQANGNDWVVRVEDSGETCDWTAEDTQASVQASAREYGIEAVPETLRHYVELGQ